MVVVARMIAAAVLRESIRSSIATILILTTPTAASIRMLISIRQAITCHIKAFIDNWSRPILHLALAAMLQAPCGIWVLSRRHLELMLPCGTACLRALRMRVVLLVIIALLLLLALLLSFLLTLLILLTILLVVALSPRSAVPLTALPRNTPTYHSKPLLRLARVEMGRAARRDRPITVVRVVVVLVVVIAG